MKVVTPEFRIAFPQLTEAKENKMNGRKEFSLVALFAKDADLSVLESKIEDAVVAKWGPDKKKHPRNLRKPFKYQSDVIQRRADEGKEPLKGYEEDAIYLDLRSNEQYPPKLVGPAKEAVLSDKFYPGCICKAAANIYTYDTAGNKGVSIGLSALQFVRDGEPFGGVAASEDDFQVEVEASFDSDEEIPF